MKAIAVLIDFSEGAENAARYALQLAQHIKANIILYTSVLLPVSESLSVEGAWPYDGTDILKNESGKELEAFAKKLRKELTPSNVFKPSITCEFGDGEFILQLNELINSNSIGLIILGAHKKSFASILTGDHAQELMDHITMPILIIAENQVFEKINKIIFATDLSPTDIDVVASLAQIAKMCSAEITLAHIGSSEIRSVDIVKHFINEVLQKISSSNISYRVVNEKKVVDGLGMLIEDITPDVLVMVHRNKTLMQQLFYGSDTQKMAAHVRMPLLVYPYPYQS